MPNEGVNPPNAVFDYTPRMPDPSQVIHFRDRSYAPNSNIVKCEWDFDDGTGSTERRPTHRYGDEGSYNVTLTVTNEQGLSDSITRAVVVDPNVNFLSPEGGTTGGKAKKKGGIRHKVKDEGGWKGLDNIIMFWDKPKFEKFKLGWSCPVGIGWFKIDVCAIVATPIEVLVNRVLDLIEWAAGGLIEMIVDWVLKLAEDIVDAVITLPPPFDVLDDLILDWVLYGSEEARMNFTATLQGILRGQTKSFLDEMGVSKSAIRSVVRDQLSDFRQSLPFDMDQPEQSLDSAIVKVLRKHGLTGEQLAETLQQQIRETWPDLDLYPPEEAIRASFVYHVSDEWLEAHGLDPEQHMANEVHVPTDLWSEFFNAIVWTPPGKLPTDWGYWTAAPLSYKEEIYDFLDIDIKQYDLADYQEELFLERSFTQLANTAAGTQGAVINWLVGSVDEWTANWEEIVTELSDILRKPISKTLQDMGFIVPPEMEKVEATVPEAIDAFMKLQHYLEEMETIETEELQKLSENLTPILEALRQLKGKQEGKEE